MNKTISSLILMGGASIAYVQAQNSPNLVLFLADDCSWSDIGCYGSPNSITPNIDRLAREGMKFNQCYQAAPMSSPTRHNLFTGMWPVKTGAYPNHTTANPGTLSVVQHLRPLGYKVALCGKSHIGPDEVFPFDSYIPLSKGSNLNFEALGQFVDECISTDSPYCILVTSHQPHSPWTVGDRSLFNADELILPEIFVDTPQTRRNYVNYLAEVNFMDNEFGTLLNLLDERDQADKSLVVYLSEHGNSFPFAKWTCYNQGVHSACIVRWPGMIKPGTVSDALVEYVDITPTFVDAAGGELQAPTDGKSFKNVLLGKTRHHKDYSFSIQTSRGIHNGPEFYGVRSVFDGRYRYIMNLTPEASFSCASMKDDYFISWEALASSDDKAAELVKKYRNRPGDELYDIKNDPYCLKNLAGEKKYEKKLAELKEKLSEWMIECGDKGQQTELDAKKYQHRAPQVGRKPKNPDAGKSDVTSKKSKKNHKNKKQNK